MLKAAVPRGESLEVRHDPDLERDNYAHSLIIGMTEDDMSKCEVLAQRTTVLLVPAKQPLPPATT